MQKDKLVVYAALSLSLIALLVALLPAAAQSPFIPVNQFAQKVLRIEVQSQAPVVQPTAIIYWFGSGYLNVSEIRVNFTNTGNVRVEVSAGLFIKANGRDIARFATARLDPGENRQFSFSIPGGVNLTQIRKIDIVVQQTR